MFLKRERPETDDFVKKNIWLLRKNLVEMSIFQDITKQKKLQVFSLQPLYHF